MHENRGKILGTILFILLILCIVYLNFFARKNLDKGTIKMVEVTGNGLLPVSEYLSFTKLNNVPGYGTLTLPVIKDRFEKHPYIEKAEIEYVGNAAVKVHLEEKKVMAVILSGAQPYFITDNLYVLPLFPNTKFIDLPVISGVPGSEDIKTLRQFKNEDVLQAFKIIEAAKLVNGKMYSALSEINMNNGKDVLLTFSKIKPPVIFGRGEEAKKMVYLDIMWNGVAEENNMIQESDYIDLRFSDEVYVGNPADTVNIGLN